MSMPITEDDLNRAVTRDQIGTTLLSKLPLGSAQGSMLCQLLETIPEEFFGACGFEMGLTDHLGAI